MIKISFKKISDFLKKYYFWILGFIFLLLICFNLFIYYKNIYLLVRTDPGFVIKEITIDRQILKNVLKNIEVREENLDRVRKKQYSDPFN